MELIKLFGATWAQVLNLNQSICNQRPVLPVHRCIPSQLDLPVPGTKTLILYYNNWHTMTFRTLTTVGLFYFIMCEDPHEHKFIEIAFSWGPRRIWLHTTLEVPWPHHMIREVCWDVLWTLSCGLSQFHGPGSWLVWEAVIGEIFGHNRLRS